MSNENTLDLDLEKLFLPAWAQQPQSKDHFAGYTGDETSEDRRGGRRGRPFGGGGGGGRPGGPSDRPQRSFDRNREGRPPFRGGDRGPGGPGGQGRPFRGSRPDGGGPRGPGGPRRDFDRGPAPERREERMPLPQVTITLMPEESVVENLVRQIRLTARAYPLFAIAKLVLKRPERQVVKIEVVKNAEGKIAQNLYVCVLDNSLWLSEDEAIQYVLDKHFDMFYKTEKIQIDPPKGVYTFVAQCGMSGIILGPPNHHDYQNKLRKLHADRFYNMPFEVFKARVKIVRDEPVVKQWIDDQSWKVEYDCLNVTESKRLFTRDEVFQHFKENHASGIIQPTESMVFTGQASRAIRSPGIARLIRIAWEDQTYFPINLVTVLSRQFASRGLHFFKVSKTITHVSVARPHYLDFDIMPVSDRIRAIVEFINTHPNCNRRKLVETMAPAHAAPAAPAAAAPVAGAEGAPAPAAEAAEFTPEQTAIVSDLHWLIHQGHVIEFADGKLEAAKKPAPRPPRPERKRIEQPRPANRGAAAPAPETQAAEAPAAPAPEATSDYEAVDPNAIAQESNPEADQLRDEAQAEAAEADTVADESAPGADPAGEPKPGA